MGVIFFFFFFLIIKKKKKNPKGGGGVFWGFFRGVYTHKNTKGGGLTPQTLPLRTRLLVSDVSDHLPIFLIIDCDFVNEINNKLCNI